MSNEIWLTIEEVSELTQEVKETVRRKCKRGKYVSKHKIEGKRKLYFVQLNSLPEVDQENYLNKLNPDFNDVAVLEKMQNYTQKLLLQLENRQINILN